MLSTPAKLPLAALAALLLAGSALADSDSYRQVIGSTTWVLSTRSSS